MGIARYFLVMFSLLVGSPAPAHDGDGPKTIEHFSVDRVTPNIYVVHGPRGMPDKNNEGFLNNPAFIVTKEGVVVVDPGGSARVGEELVKKIRTVTDKPVIAIFNTHIHGDHWLGNDGVRRAYPNVVIYAHQRMVERLNRGEGEEWAEMFNRATEGATAGTRVVGPTVGVKGGERLNLGGMQFRIHHPGKAHTDTDIMIEVVDDKAVFLGDIVTYRAVPAVRPQDANFKGSLTALRGVMQLPVKIYIPGHGPTGDQNLPLGSLRFLEALYNAVTKYHRQGLTDFEMKGPVMRDLSEYRDWHYFDGMGRTISYLYLEIEADSFQTKTSEDRETYSTDEARVLEPYAKICKWNISCPDDRSILFSTDLVGEPYVNSANRRTFLEGTVAGSVPAGEP